MDSCLKLAILRQLSVKPLSGYSLMGSIRAQTGWKPSPGSVYPLLNQLLKAHAVTAKDAGRRKIYTLTEKGENELRQAIQENKGRLTRIAGQLKVCGGKDISTILDRLGKGEPPFGWLSGDMLDLRRLALAASDISSEKREPIQKALRQLIATLRRAV